MCVLDWNLLLEYLKVFLSWPTVTAALILTITYKFKNSITALIANIGHLKGTIAGQNIELLIQQAVPKNEEGIEANIVNNGDADPNLPDDAIEDMPDELRNLADVRQLIASVARYPIRAIINQWNTTEHLNFERYYIRMFASQIGMLHFLSTKGDENWTTIDDIEQISYGLYLVKGGNKEYSFRQFINYVIEPSFVWTKLENNKEFVKVSPRGRRFVSYISLYYSDRWKQKEF